MPSKREAVVDAMNAYSTHFGLEVPDPLVRSLTRDQLLVQIMTSIELGEPLPSTQEPEQRPGAVNISEVNW